MAKSISPALQSPEDRDGVPEAVPGTVRCSPTTALGPAAALVRGRLSSGTCLSYGAPRTSTQGMKFNYSLAFMATKPILNLLFGI